MHALVEQIELVFDQRVCGDYLGLSDELEDALGERLVAFAATVSYGAAPRLS